MNKELIKQLLDDKETRKAIAAPFGIGDGPMCAALKTLIDETAKGEVIMVETSSGEWEIGKYICTQADGRMAVIATYANPNTYDVNEEVYIGKRVDLVVKCKGEPK